MTNTFLRADSAVGQQLPEIAWQFRLESFQRGGQPNIHTDAEAARREGLDAPVATGPQIAALTFRQLRTCFGAGWITGGICELTFRKPVRIDDFCVAKGVVTGRDVEAGAVRLTCDVWIENGEGDKVIVGTASGLVSDAIAVA